MSELENQTEDTDVFINCVNSTDPELENQTEDTDVFINCVNSTDPELENQTEDTDAFMNGVDSIDVEMENQTKGTHAFMNGVDSTYAEMENQTEGTHAFMNGVDSTYAEMENQTEGTHAFMNGVDSTNAEMENQTEDTHAFMQSVDSTNAEMENNQTEDTHAFMQSVDSTGDEMENQTEGIHSFMKSVDSTDAEMENQIEDTDAFMQSVDSTDGTSQAQSLRASMASRAPSTEKGSKAMSSTTCNTTSLSASQYPATIKQRFHESSISSISCYHTPKCCQCPRLPIGRVSLLSCKHSMCGCTVKQGTIIIGWVQTSVCLLLILLSLYVIFSDAIDENCWWLYRNATQALATAEWTTATGEQAITRSSAASIGVPRSGVFWQQIGRVLIIYYCRKNLLVPHARFWSIVLSVSAITLTSDILLLVGAYNDCKGLMLTWMMQHAIVNIALVIGLFACLTLGLWQAATISVLSLLVCTYWNMVVSGHYNVLADGYYGEKKLTRRLSSSLSLRRLRDTSSEALQRYVAQLGRYHSFKRYVRLQAGRHSHRASSQECAAGHEAKKKTHDALPRTIPLLNMKSNKVPLQSVISDTKTV